MAARAPMRPLGTHPLKMIKKKPIKKWVTLDVIEKTGKKLSNWGKWGPKDEVGTLNFVGPKELVNAGRMIKKGKAFSLGLPFDQNGPQVGSGWGRRFNPIHAMLASGVDAVAGRLDKGKIRYADDFVIMPLQCGTQWDALGHIFYKEKMWNGYDARLVDSAGAEKNGIEKVKDRMAGRGVLLDIPRFLGGDYLEDGFAVTNQILDACAKKQKVEIKRGDFVIVRTGQMENCLYRGDWGGYSGGDAPGLAFENCEWLHDHEVAAICTDTWGCEVRPNESEQAFQPWHWIVIPMMGITMGEIFYLKDLADDCAKDKVYEFFFTAPPLPITGAVGSPINPMAIK